MRKLETNTIDSVSGTTNLTIGSTNTSTITVPNGKLTGQNYPAFHAYMSSDLEIPSNTATKLQVYTKRSWKIFFIFYVRCLFSNRR